MNRVLRLPGSARGPVLGAFGAMLAAQAAGTALGLGFWIVTARLVGEQEVGLAAGAISAQTLVGFIAALGIGTHLVVVLPTHDAAARRRLVLGGVAIAALAGALLGGVGLLLARAGWLGETLGTALRGQGATAFVLGVAAAAAAVVVDEAVLGLGRTRVQVWRNLAAAGIRFPVAALAITAGYTDSSVLQWCWVVPLLLSVGVGLLASGVLRVPSGAAASSVGALRTHVAPALRHHLLTIAVAAATQIVPVIAAITLVPEANARFAVAWLAATLVFLPPYLLTVALFAGAAAEGHDREHRVARVRETVRWTLPGALGLSLLLVVGAAVLGGPVMSVFGETYAADAAHLLALLAPAGLWMVVKDHLVALWRAEERQGRAARLCALGVVLESTGAAVGGVRDGADGLAVGWLIGLTVEAVVFLPALRRAFGAASSGRPHRIWPGAVMVSGLLAVTVVIAGIQQPLPDLLPWQRLPGSSAPGQAVLAGAELRPDTAPCLPTADEPGPRLDLGIQPAVAPDRELSDRAIRQLLGRARAAGATVISTSVSWAAAQPRRGAPIDLGPAQRVVRAARAAGFQVRVQLAGAPRWAVARGEGMWRPPTTPAERGEWSRFVATTLRTLPAIDFLEVWSEPDNPAYWPRPSAPSYGRLLRATAGVVDRVRPATRVITGGLDGNDTAYLGGLLDWSREHTADGRLPAQYVGVHPFAGTEPPTRSGPQGAEGFLGYRALLDQMRAAGAVAAGVRVYVGEFGYPSGGRDGIGELTRVTYARQALGLLTCTPRVAVLSWYYLHPTAYDPARWTLLDRRFRPDATYRSIARWYAVAPQAHDTSRSRQVDRRSR